MRTTVLRLLTAALVAVSACQAQPQFSAVSSVPLTIPELKYRLIDVFGPVQFCGPPVARGGEAAKADALAAFPQIEQDRDALDAILRRNHFPAAAELTADQKVVVYDEYQRLKMIPLEPTGDKQRFGALFADSGDPKRTVFIAGAIDPFGAIEVTAQDSRGPLNCPVCLAAGTWIDTPGGRARVEELEPGMAVWSIDATGQRVEARVERTSRVPAPQHKVVHLRLADGRELLASPGHPFFGGRLLGGLAVGDAVDGSTVAVVELVSYSGAATFDILPSGPTGAYWANGVLLESTLKG